MFSSKTLYVHIYCEDKTCAKFSHIKYIVICMSNSKDIDEFKQRLAGLATTI